jgi:hypothetical protein
MSAASINILPFWQAVHQKQAEIDIEIAKQTLQPRGENCVYITSLPPMVGKDPQIRSGVVCQSTKKIAAQRICENSHRLSTDDEIADYLRDQENRKKEHQSSLDARRGMTTFSQPLPASQFKGGK